MADVQEVLIDFKVDTSQLTTAQEQLAKGGKVDTTQYAALSKVINTTATDTKGLITQFKNVANTAVKMGKSVEDAFGAGVQDALDQAGVSAEDFAVALAKANAPTQTLKAELKGLKEQLALAKFEGRATGDAYDALRARAAELADSIDDASKEIKNAGSDTRNLDNVVGSISALAGGFAAVQGAIGLFGDKNEDLEKSLLKVNSAMALASGIQQVYNATLKEGSLSKITDTVATNFNIAAQKIYTLVTGEATVATKAFKIALAATGIGAIVLLVLSLASAMGAFDDNTKSASDAVDDLAKSFETLDGINERFLSSLSQQNKLALEGLKQTGASEKELSDKEIKFLRISEAENFKAYQTKLDQIKILSDANTKSLNEEISNRKKLNELAAQAGRQTLPFDETKYRLANEKKFSEETAKLRDEADKSRVLALTAARQADLADAQEKTKSIEDQRKAAEDAAKKLKAQREKDAAEAKAERARALQDQLAALERQLLTVKKNSQEEVDIEQKIVDQKAKIALNAEKLKVNQIALINETANRDKLALQQQFNKKSTEEELKGQIDYNSAVLASLQITNDQKLEFQIKNIQASAQLEINAAAGNADKILLIEAKKYQDIGTLQNAEIQKQLAAELESADKINSILKSSLSKLASDRKVDINVRIAAMKGVEAQELTAVDKRIAANEKIKQSDEDYQTNFKKLQDERAAIVADTEQKIADTEEQAAADRKERNIKLAQETLAVLGQAADFLAALGQLATDQETARIQAQKKQLQDLVDAGAISEKAAKVRAQQIQVLEAQAKQKQAQREKQAAVFQAVLAIPQSFLTGLSQGGPILGAIYAAIAAAQAAIIIARPVPKFFRGKKDRYEGHGEVADMGSEIVERNGRMFLYTKPTHTYLNATDKVYTHAETKQILHSTDTRTIKEGTTERFDYDRLARAIPKSSFSVNIDKDFIEESVGKGLSKNRYFNNRYKF